MSNSNLKPIRLWGQGGPNPPKVAFILSELNIPYEIIPLPISEVKAPAYVALNPNGRIPTIEDPNTGITLWESGAIVEYLIANYDKELSISFPAGSAEDWHAKQWLFFQTSGQGPYYGQAAWFKRYHPEQVPSALARYINEMKRVSGVLESWLGKEKVKHGGAGNGPWLVGNKKSYADIAFLQYQLLMSSGLIFGKEEFDGDEFPLVKRWIEKLQTSKVQAVLDASRSPKPFEGFDKYL